MIDFKNVELGDAGWVKPLLQISDFRGSEYNFTNNFIWKDIYHIAIAPYKGFYAIKSGLDPKKMSFLYPAGDGNFQEFLQEAMLDLKQNGQAFSMHGIGKEGMARMEEAFPGRFVFQEERDLEDYIYNAEDLRNLAGKKFHAKRNHISKFLRQYPDYQFELINQNNIEECVKMNHKWCEINECYRNESLEQEACAVKMALGHYFQLGLQGALLRVNGQVCAYTVGEPLNSDTFLVHIEKAFYDIDGAYPMINREFVRACAGGAAYINREEDTGDEGLRKAKLSYNPAFLQQKFSARLKDEL